ncbi:VOC family protein [Parahaliea mediterranea]|uniref:VOC family protein n=1 Tax=Parahaliea mediterranea TaxID=651086 RepID=A0A939IMJ3_9GAMM|nr:VOC family protein [Parahaliea mediterranea]MBN7797072.1 VOC family protein [Parahaliea mediterranea]
MFHLALPVDDLKAAAHFYGEVLGCRRGRSSSRWIDFDFWGHQLVTHQVPQEVMQTVATNPVDGEDVPASHFGAILSWDQLQALVERLREREVPFVIEPVTRFAGRRGEQRTLFIRDPAGNYLEFKAFRNIDMLFASDGLDYP